MSEAVDLFEFDFGVGVPVAKARTRRTLTARGGPANCIAQWIHLQLDGASEYENRPGEPAFSCWAVLVYPWAKQLELRAGERVTVGGSHDLCSVNIWTLGLAR